VARAFVTRLVSRECKDCDCVYVGQTSRALKTRMKEHAKAIATLDKNSLLAKHHMLNGHQIDLENVENCRQIIGVETTTNS